MIKPPLFFDDAVSVSETEDSEFVVNRVVFSISSTERSEDSVVDTVRGSSGTSVVIDVGDFTAVAVLDAVLAVVEPFDVVTLDAVVAAVSVVSEV